MSKDVGGTHKVPVVMQMEATECGAASLTMILAYYGLWLPLALVRDECGVSRDGSSLGNVSRAARNRGMETKAYKIEPKDLHQVHLPCICHWEFNHFIVVTGIKGNNVYVNDPGRGRIKMSIEEFDRGMTGVILTMKPGTEFKRGGHRTSILSFAKEHLHGAREAILFTFFTGFLLAACGVLTPIMTQIFADDILTGHNPHWFVPFIATFCFLILIQTSIYWVIAKNKRAFTMKLSIIGSSKFLWHLLHLPMSFFTQRSAGDIVMRQNCAASVATTLVEQFAPSITNIGLLIIYLYFMIRYSMVLAGIAAFAAIMNLFLIKIASSKQEDLTRSVDNAYGKQIGATMASIGCIETVKAAGAEAGFFKRWAGYFTNYTNAQIKMNHTMSYVEILPPLLTTICNTVVLAIGTYYILKGNMTVGMLMAFQSFMSAFNTPVAALADSISNLLSMRSNMERMDDVYRYDPDVATQTHENAETGIGKLMGQVDLNHVTFGYSKLAAPLLEDFSLHLEPGQSVAFVGGSGCGKSTLSKLIAGLYQPWQGEVLFDGKNLRDIDRDVFVGSVAVIDQDITLFDGTLADNVKMWDTTMEDFAMILACHQAQLHEEIAKRPEAYDTKVRDGGSNFSGGQRQRIEIATALVREPSVLIMDEATSALDAVTEHKVMQAVKALGCTLIIVAHRLSTIRDCDEIIVLDHGHVAERGTHEQLMENEGYYYQLMNTQ